MNPSLTVNTQGEIQRISHISTKFLTYLKDEEPELLLSLIKDFRLNHSKSNSGTLRVFDCDIEYHITFSSNFYTIFFNTDNCSMTKDGSDNEKYKLIVEAANEIIYEMDELGHFTYVNPKTLEMTGYKESEILGKSYLELVHPDHRGSAQAFYRDQVVERKKSTFQEIPIITKNGEQFWIGLSVQLLESDFAVTGFLGVGRDITETYNSRLALEQSEEKYRGIIQNLQYGLMEVDLEEKIIYANEAMSHITGYSKEELIGKVASNLLADERGLEILEKQHGKRDNGTASVYEIPMRHKDGSYRWAMISGAPIYNVDGSVKGSIGIHLDITNRIKAEEELKETRSRLKKYKDGLEALNTVTANPTFSLGEQVIEGLSIAKSYLGMDLGIISEINGAKYGVKYFISSEENPGLNIGDEFKLSDTFCELVFNDKEIVYTHNVTKSELNEHPCHHIFGIESYLGVSYTVNGEMRGTVNFSSPSARELEFDSYDLEFVNLFSKWIGYTITLYENQEKQESDKAVLAQKNEELERNQQYLGAINDFVTKLLEDESISEISWEIAEKVIDRFGFDDCVIYLVNEDEVSLNQVAAYGPKQAKNRQVKDAITIPFGHGIVGAVAKNGKAEIIGNTSKDPRYLVDDAVRFSEIAVPIIADNKVIGVIDSEHQEKNFFNEEHLHTLTTIANIAANRLKNALAKKDQERAEKELKDSEQKFRKILHNAIDAVVSINSEGIITEWNNQAEVIFGFSAEEAVGKSLTETIIPHQHHQSHNNGMKHFHRTGEGPVLNQKIEITALRKSGEEFPIEMAIIPIENKGEHTFTAFLSDITIQKRVQTEMEKALNKERELNELKSRFVSMTSHEFRTPLTTIKQNTDLISYQLESLVPDNFPMFKKYLDRIDGDLNRLTSLMNDILMLGRIEAGKVQLKKHSTDFVAFTEKLVHKYNDTDIENRKMNFEVNGIPRPVEIDLQLMDHVLSNLLSNALKYSPGKAAPRVSLNFNFLNKLEFRVKDYGIGIPEKEQKSLFESFYRATNVRNIQGSGLGLSIVKEFTEMHGGVISVESKVGEGSEFVIELPLS